MYTPAEMESVVRLLHVHIKPDGFIPSPSIPCHFGSLSLFQANTWGKKKVSLRGSYHLLRIGLRPAETRFACDLHNSGLDVWPVEGEKTCFMLNKKKNSRPLQTPCLFGISCMFSFLCFPFSAFGSETSFQGYRLTNGIKIALLKCSEVGQG